MKESLKLLLPVAALLAAGVVYVSWAPDEPTTGGSFEHPPVTGIDGGSRPASALMRAGGSGAPGASGAEPAVGNVSKTFYTEVAIYRQRLDDNPADTLAMRKLARLLQDGHGEDEASALYERYLELAPGNRQVWLDLAATQGSRRRWDEADRAMDRMLDRFPGDESALYNKGAIAANSGRKSEAERLWRDLVSDGADQTIVRRARSSLERLAGS